MVRIEIIDNFTKIKKHGAFDLIDEQLCWLKKNQPIN